MHNFISFPGGGVLAHTILGVDFNDQTGDIRSVSSSIHLSEQQNVYYLLPKLYFAAFCFQKHLRSGPELSVIFKFDL